MEVLALGQMGMSEEDFGFMTPRTFFNKLKGFAKIRQEDFQNSWEQTRWMTWQLISVSGKIVKKRLGLTDIIKFKWENVERTKKDEITDKENFERLVKKFGKQWHSS